MSGRFVVVENCDARDFDTGSHVGPDMGATRRRTWATAGLSRRYRFRLVYAGDMWSNWIFWDMLTNATRIEADMRHLYRTM